jgi:hypothetical protein
VRLLATLLIAAVVLASVTMAAGCGGANGGETSGTTASKPPAATVATGPATGKLPPGAVGPVDTHEEATEGPAATEASPEASAEGPAATGDLSDADRAAVGKVVSDYIAALDRHRAARVCALLEPGALNPAELPARRDGCRASLAASIGTRPRSGGPAWRRTALVEVKAEDLGDDRARVTATVTHHFSDRKYVSVEDDVIYLERVGGRWLLAKPSGTLYRAVGYPEPPLRALSPPTGW